MGWALKYRCFSDAYAVPVPALCDSAVPLSLERLGGGGEIIFVIARIRCVTDRVLLGDDPRVCGNATGCGRPAGPPPERGQGIRSRTAAYRY